MPKIIVTADLHLGITPSKAIADLVAKLAAAQPEAIVVAGDLGEPFHIFERCLELLVPLRCPVGIIAGNHDIWVRPDDGYDSAELFFNKLPAAVRARGMTWLESDPIRLSDGTAIVGTLGWYDYSCRSAATQHWNDGQFASAKAAVNNDGNFVAWQFTDPEFAAVLASGLERRLVELESDTSVTRVLVATHVPVCREQLVRGESDNAVADAYFANFSLGAMITKYRKVAAVVSGHTHRSVPLIPPSAHALAPRVATIGSRYLAPAFEIIEL